MPDPRARRGQRHPWVALLLLLAAALLSGANTQRAIARWGQHQGRRRLRHLGFTHQPPSQPTLHRLLVQVDIGTLEAVLGAWLQQVRIALRPAVTRWVDGIAVDGKTLRGARRRGAAEAHLLSASCQPQGVVLGQRAVPTGTNEQGAVAALLDQLLLAGETLTFDAQFTQQAIAHAVVARGAAYLLVAKDNQPGLQRAIATNTHPDRRSRHLGHARSLQVAHGRIEERTLVVATATGVTWPHAQQVLRLRRRVWRKRSGGVLSDETAYAVTSLTVAQASAADLLRLWQTHWTIENPVHWVRDVVFGEDRATTRTGTAHQALAALRNLALSLLRLWRGPQITAAREYFAAHPATLLRRLVRSPL